MINFVFQVAFKNNCMKRMLKKYWWVVAIILVVAFWSKIKEIPAVKTLCEKMGFGEPEPTTTNLTTQEEGQENPVQ